MKYVFDVSDDVMRYLLWIPFAHGWIYVVYLVTVLDLWTKMRWGWGRLATMVFAGVVPVMSFVLEKKVHTEAEAKARRPGGAVRRVSSSTAAPGLAPLVEPGR
ncbi:DUF3817 domain-containing protein [Cellulosimicrobium sp. Marseille-Q8652]